MKKVVKAKPAPKPVPSKSEPRKKQDEKSAAPAARTIVRKEPVVSERLGSSPLHTGPKVIRPTNLPPVPNQGLTINDTPQRVQRPPQPQQGRRVYGTVGGRPARQQEGSRAPGKVVDNDLQRPPYQGERTAPRRVCPATASGWWSLCHRLTGRVQTSPMGEELATGSSAPAEENLHKTKGSDLQAPRC